MKKTQPKVTWKFIAITGGFFLLFDALNIFVSDWFTIGMCICMGFVCGRLATFIK